MFVTLLDMLLKLTTRWKSLYFWSNNIFNFNSPWHQRNVAKLIHFYILDRFTIVNKQPKERRHSIYKAIQKCCKFRLIYSPHTNPKTTMKSLWKYELLLVLTTSLQFSCTFGIKLFVATFNAYMHRALSAWQRRRFDFCLEDLYTGCLKQTGESNFNTLLHVN